VVDGVTCPVDPQRIGGAGHAGGEPAAMNVGIGDLQRAKRHQPVVDEQGVSQAHVTGPTGMAYVVPTMSLSPGTSRVIVHEPGNVHPRRDQAAKGLLRASFRSQRAHDLGSTQRNHS